jgi:hypothetical protein
MGIMNAIKQFRVPTTKEIVETPSRIRNETKKVETNSINVRFFNNDFSECIPSIGIISRKTSIPIVHFDHPEKLGCILLDNCTYFDHATNKKTIDICESYIFGLDKDIELDLDLTKEYYNDIKLGLLDKDSDRIKKLHSKTGRGYYIPVLLNNIPREIIKIDAKKKLTGHSLEHKIEITQYMIRQLGTVRMLERLEKKDNSVIVACALMFIPLGAAIGAFITAYLLG